MQVFRNFDEMAAANMGQPNLKADMSVFNEIPPDITVKQGHSHTQREVIRGDRRLGVVSLPIRRGGQYAANINTAPNTPPTAIGHFPTLDEAVTAIAAYGGEGIPDVPEVHATRSGGVGSFAAATGRAWGSDVDRLVGSLRDSR